MTPRFAVRLAWSVGALCMALVVASLVLLALDWSVITDPLSTQFPWFLNVVIVGALGLLIARRRPTNPIGWLMLAIAVANGFNLLGLFLAVRGLLAGASPQGWVEWPAWVSNWSAGGGLLLILLVLFFPNGRLPGPRWRWVMWFGVAATALLSAGVMLDPTPVAQVPGLASVGNPVGVTALRGVSQVASFLLVPLLVAAVIAVVVRLRRATGDERRQLRWFVYVVSAGIGIVLAGFAVQAVDGNVGSAISGTAFDVSFAIAMPAAIGLAVIRYGLYDIDVFISRAIVYGSLAVSISAVYVGIAVGVGALVGGGGKPNLGLSILATAIVAVGFQPLRERLQRVANRLVYGKRATPYEVLSQFSERVAESYAMDEVMPRMARVLAEGTGAQRADVWLRAGDSLRVAASWPADAAPAGPVELNGGSITVPLGVDRMVAVRQQAEVLGALSVSKRAGEQLAPVEEKLLDDLAHQAGLVLKNVGLTADLQRRLDELRLSRQRLVSAQDEERRRLERNLHDGAQQHLVALKVKLGLAQMLIGRDPDRAMATLGQLKTDADDALETLRDLARGIYPPVLADRGLVAALQSQARKAMVPVTVEGDGIGRYSQEAEAAVYFSVLEALQNVQKYAEASVVIVRLREDADRLRFTVEDDGRGFDVDSVSRGSGLTNMEDRLEALGGDLRVASSVGKGTSVAGSLAITSPAMMAAVGSG